jgi:FdhE protein
VNPSLRETEAVRASWEDLLTRRPQYRDSLRLYDVVIETWSRWTPPERPVLDWRPEQCRERWARGVSLVAEAPPAFDPVPLEPLMGPVLDELSLAGAEEAAALDRFARAWDDGRLTPVDLLAGVPRRSGQLRQTPAGIPPDLLSLVTYLGLRPAMEAYVAPARPAFGADLWDGGACPFCAASPSFADMADDGKRWLYCALCGGRWTIGRLRCPFCDNRDAKTLTRLAAEGEEEGYLIEACELCRGYLKGVDRRLRWNVGSSLVEDWGTPHLDLIARRKGYWRATPSLIQLAPPDP